MMTINILTFFAAVLLYYANEAHRKDHSTFPRWEELQKQAQEHGPLFTAQRIPPKGYETRKKTFSILAGLSFLAMLVQAVIHMMNFV